MKRVPDAEALVVFQTCFGKFTAGVDRKWWWEGFSQPSAAAHFDDGQGFKSIVTTVPDPGERIWFIAEEDQMAFYPVYETTPRTAQKVIGECYGFEYYMISKDFRWLLCENHHNVMIGIGPEITSQLERKTV
jgi:hypothetical protein